MPFHGLLGGKAGAWLLARCVGAPVPTEVSAAVASGDSLDDLPCLPSFFGDEISLAVKGNTVLDYGCGYGRMVVSVAKSDARLAVGLDIRETVLQAGRALANEERVVERCLFMNADDAAAVASFEGRIDVILSIDGFEHFADPAAVLKHMHQLLRPGGVAYISFGPPWWHPYGSHLTFMGVPPWVHVLFKEDIILALRARYRSDGARRFEEVEGGLNRMTIARFERLIRGSGFHILHLDLIPIRHTRLLGRTQWGRELFTSIVRASLIKCDRAV